MNRLRKINFRLLPLLAVLLMTASLTGCHRWLHHHGHYHHAGHAGHVHAQHR